MTARKPSYSIGRLLSVLSEARRLQRVIRSNQKDADLRKNVEIHHIVDTRILGLLAEPKLHYSMVAPFGSLLLDDDDDRFAANGSAPDYDDIIGEAGRPLTEAKAILYANAMLTGELLVKFAQEAGSQAILISPEHISEVYGYISALEHRASSESNGGPQDALESRDVATKLAMELKSIRQRRASGEVVSAEVCRAVVDQLALLSQMPGMAMKRLEAHLVEGRIGNAAQVLNFDLTLIAPAEEIVRQWRMRISRAKRNNSIKPNAHALEADAVTLSQIQIFNECNVTQKCVLISDDRGLQEAYFRFKKEPGNKHHLYAIRDPRQYMPVLNLGEETGKYTNRNVFINVRNSIDRLLTSFASPDFYDNDPNSDKQWSEVDKLAHRLMKNISPEFSEEVRLQIGELSSAWAEMLEHSLVAKSDALVDLADRENQVMLKSGIEESGQRLSQRFLDLTESSVLLRNEILIIEKRDVPSSNNRRMLVSDFSNFESPLFSGQSLNENVSLLKSKIDMPLSRFVEQDRDERLLVLSGLCLDIGAWDAASTLLAASRKRGKLSLVREIEFFSLVARRLSIGRKGTILTFNSILKELDSIDHGPDPLLRLRLQSEMVALGLSRWAFRAHFGKYKQGDLDQTLATWSEFSKSGAKHLNSRQSHTAWQGLQKQYVLNTFCLAFWAVESNSKMPNILASSTYFLLEVLEDGKFSHIRDGDHGNIYPILGRYALAGNSEKADLASLIVGAIEEATIRDRMSGILFDLPYIDRIELAYINQTLRLRHNLVT